MPPNADDLSDALRQMPSVDECVRALAPEVQNNFNRGYLVSMVRAVQDQLRRALAAGTDPLPTAAKPSSSRSRAAPSIKSPHPEPDGARWSTPPEW